MAEAHGTDSVKQSGTHTAPTGVVDPTVCLLRLPHASAISCSLAMGYAVAAWAQVGNRQPKPSANEKCPTRRGWRADTAKL